MVSDDQPAVTGAPTRAPRPAEEALPISDIVTRPPLRAGVVAGAPSQAPTPPPAQPAAGSARRPPAVRGKAQIGLYEVLERLGSGGMGTVYKAWHPLRETFCALKVIARDRASEGRFPVLCELFLRESRILLSVDHENVVRCIDANEAEFEGEPALYLAMEYLEGESLEQRLARGPLPVAEALRIAGAVSRALEAVHEREPPILHRDVKPANIFLTGDGKVKLIDFGLAAVADWRLSHLSVYAAGSKPWMAPEQFEGLRFCTKQSDLYSLGVTLFQMVTGVCPFDCDSDQGYFIAHKDTSPPSLIDASPKIERGALLDSVQNIVTKLLAKRPAERFQSASELLETIERALSGGSISKPWITRPESVRLRRNAARFISGTMVLLVVAVLAVWWTRSTIDERVATARALFDERAYDAAERAAEGVLARKPGYGPAQAVIDGVNRCRDARREVQALSAEAEKARLDDDVKTFAAKSDEAHRRAVDSRAFTDRETRVLAETRERAGSLRRERFEAATASATASLESRLEDATQEALSRAERLASGGEEARTLSGLRAWQTLLGAERELGQGRLPQAERLFEALDLPLAARESGTVVGQRLAASRALERALEEDGRAGAGRTIAGAIETAERTGLARWPHWRARIDLGCRRVLAASLEEAQRLDPRKDADKVEAAARLALRFLPDGEGAARFRAAVLSCSRAAGLDEARSAARVSLRASLGDGGRKAWDALDEAHAWTCASTLRTERGTDEVVVFVPGYRVLFDETWVAVMPFLIGRCELSPDEALRRLPGGATLTARMRAFRPGDRSPIGGLGFDEAVALAGALQARLPTEEEWRVAALVERAHPGGPHRDPFQAGVLTEQLVPVDAATRDESPWGCLFMGSNVMEWVRSSHGKNEGVLIGGSYKFAASPRSVRSAILEPCPPAPTTRSDDQDDFGLRLARDVSLPDLDGLLR